MKRFSYTILLLSSIALLLFPQTTYAQSDGEIFASALCICSLSFLLINIAILVWVIRDAQARGTSAGAWLSSYLGF